MKNEKFTPRSRPQMGQVVSFLLPIYLHWAEIFLFALFGIKFLYEASKMPKNRSNSEEEKEAMEAVEASDFPKRKGRVGVLIDAFSLTFIAEGGDRAIIPARGS
jgi:putative Ca2+/H+ antiporter (TMEM165/GDT1 family)